MKHSGLAAELHVVHRTFLVDTEGKEGEEGESRERQVTRAHGSIPHRGAEPSPAPALPADFQLPPRCRDTGTHPLATRQHLCSTCGPEEHLAEGQRPGARPPPSASRWKAEHPDDKLLSGWDCAKSQTAPHTRAQVHRPLPLFPPTPKQQGTEQASSFMTNIGKTFTNVTNAK